MNGIIDDLCDQLKVDEGWSATVYKDSLGVKTIGYGFVVDPSKPGGLPKDIAEIWLRKLAQEKMQGLYHAIPWLSSQPRDVQVALCNMTYQMGVEGVLGFHDMLGRLKVNNRQGAAAAAKDSLWYKQTPERAAKVIAMIGGGA